MAKEQQEIKDNYTYLGFAWLKGLSEVRYYDLRNEASKLMADDLCLHVKEQPERVCLVYEGAEEMEINPSDEEQMAKMFTCYLLAGSMDGYGEFVDYALDTHRTLQQNLTRFCGMVCKSRKRLCIFKTGKNGVFQVFPAIYLNYGGM